MGIFPNLKNSTTSESEGGQPAGDPGTGRESCLQVKNPFDEKGKGKDNEQECCFWWTCTNLCSLWQAPQTTHTNISLEGRYDDPRSLRERNLWLC